MQEHFCGSVDIEDRRPKARLKAPKLMAKAAYAPSTTAMDGGSAANAGAICGEVARRASDSRHVCNALTGAWVSPF